MVGEFATAAAALARVREALRRPDPHGEIDLMLVVEDEHGRSTMIAAGETLTELALAADTAELRPKLARTIWRLMAERRRGSASGSKTPTP